jgi:hypothetical protein
LIKGSAQELALVLQVVLPQVPLLQVPVQQALHWLLAPVQQPVVQTALHLHRVLLALIAQSVQPSPCPEMMHIRNRATRLQPQLGPIVPAPVQHCLTWQLVHNEHHRFGSLCDVSSWFSI